VPDFTIAHRGTDSSGRPIFATDYMWSWWERVCDELGFTPTIVQGAFMARAGGGASASAGYHDGGGCFDLRTWDRTADEVEQIIRVTRRLGAMSWVRDHRHGMDPHIHLGLGTDKPLAVGALRQWQAYLSGHDGLTSNGPDYEWRPTPLVTTPPEEEDDMPFTEKQLRQIVREEVAAELDRAEKVTDGTAEKKRSLRQMVKELWLKRNT
jgi:hypothetical protein